MPETTKLKVLVADDEQVIANTLAIILNRAGFDARAVYSGEKLVEMA
jgi:DNA-binding response OmpR family regulator